MCVFVFSTTRKALRSTVLLIWLHFESVSEATYFQHKKPHISNMFYNYSSHGMQYYFLSVALYLIFQISQENSVLISIYEI